MSTTTERLHALDAVRAFALLLGVVFHAGFSFIPGLIPGLWAMTEQLTEHGRSRSCSSRRTSSGCRCSFSSPASSPHAVPSWRLADSGRTG